SSSSSAWVSRTTFSSTAKPRGASASGGVRPGGASGCFADVRVGGFRAAVDFGDDLRGKVEATAAAGRLAEVAVDLLRAAQAGLGRVADVAVSMTVADANVHGGKDAADENRCQ